jgi:hypothetical protein
MDNKKYEHLINLVINENREQASELFHEIVVEKSREIFESIMAEEYEDDMEEGMGGQVGDLMDEITAEEEGTGMYEDADDEADIEFDDSAEADGEEMTHDIEMGGEEEEGEETEHAEIEDSVIRIEDKLDQLMAEFEEIMGGSSEGEEEGSEEEVEVSDEEEALSEAVQLQKVSVTHGDNGVQNKSTVAANSGQKGMDSKPVKFSNTENEKGRPAPTTKDLKGAGQFKNTPGKKTVDLSAAPKPKKGDDGSNTKSPVAK